MLRRPDGQTPGSCAPTDGTDPSVAGGRVLLIDDSPVVLDAVGDLIESWGHQVTTAERADAGLEALGQSSFDVVVADVSMPGMDGLELLAAMRRAQLDIPVIMLSASNDSRIVMRAVHDGAFDYVNKDDGLRAAGLRRPAGHGSRAPASGRTAGCWKSSGR